MSSAALAKKRRANISTQPPVPPNVSTPTSNSVDRKAITLPQVLGMIEKRLISLEKVYHVQNKPNEVINGSAQEKEILDEYESRFEMLAVQIGEMKDTMQKLQTFTMDVTQKMFERLNNSEEKPAELEIVGSQKETNINTIVEEEEEDDENDDENDDGEY